MQDSAYRPDIDGLRALAVVPVVLYHAGVRGFSGGFVGVDIFFVISGYLITGILVRDIAAGRYSIVGFYRRRVLRIFPALFVMLAVVSVVACATLLPNEIGRFARSVGATALFSSNILFYGEADYFDPGAAAKPLLHTWSLAVEEQWYILWPVLLAAIGADRPTLLKVVAIGTTLASFVLGLWLIDVDSSATFFLLPTRAWEMGLGAILAIIPMQVRKGWTSEIAAVVGVGLILFSIKVYTHETPFPGIAALPPCAGAALLIWSGGGGGWVAQLLSWRWVRFIGLISFSLYLWHWPVIVFAKVGLLARDSLVTQAGTIAASVVLATLSWRYVERPFRAGAGGWRTSRILLGSGLAIAAALAVAVGTSLVNRLLVPLTPQQSAVARYLDFAGDANYRRGTCFAVGPRDVFDAQRCLMSSGQRPALLLVGDSYAAHLWPGLSQRAAGYDVLQATATGCLPRLYPGSGTGYCERLIDGVLRDWVPRHRPAVLVLAGRWQWRSLPGLEQTLVDPAIRAANPILVGPMPEYAAALPRLLVVGEIRNDPALAARALTEEVFAIDLHMREMARRTGTPYISLVDALCQGRNCRTWVSPGVPLQFDIGHLTLEGSALVADTIVGMIDAARR